MTPRVAVISTFSVVSREELSRSLEEMIFEASTGALNAAGLTADDVDGIVLSGNDQIDGRVISVMSGAGPAGGVNHDTTMISSSGDHALVYGFLRLRSGQGKNVLVVGWAKPSESVAPLRAELMSAEPYLLRQFGMTNAIASALQASRWKVRDGLIDYSKIVAWPLRESDLPAIGDSVHAVVLAVEGAFQAETELAWIIDAAWATVSYELGDRDLTSFDSLQLAMDQMRRREKTIEVDQWSAIEIGAGSEQAVEAVVRLLKFNKSSTINASGSLATKPTSPHVSGLARMVAAINAVKEQNILETEVASERLTAGIGFNGFAGQGATVMVFSNSKIRAS